ncbi:MAG TPA: metallophosphoesterase family protein [Terriglobales bacterium]|nr:metallophosphoesterase family protein [Terriglobales bacterium]
MRILIISDIHANLEGLEAALAAAPKYDLVLNLGDIVGYGASPNEVTDRSRQLGKIFVRGNHDKACTGVMGIDGFNPVAGLAAMWTKQNLKPDNLEFLKNLPQGPVKVDGLENMQLVHGSPLDEDEYIIVQRDAYEPLTKAAAPLTFFGHTHIQGGFAVDGEGVWTTIRPLYKTKDQAESYALKLAVTTKYLINPGSTGQPRDGDPRAAFLTYDTEKSVVTYHRVPYDIKGAQKRIFDAKLPDRLALRLADGR